MSRRQEQPNTDFTFPCCFLQKTTIRSSFSPASHCYLQRKPVLRLKVYVFPTRFDSENCDPWGTFSSDFADSEHYAPPSYFPHTLLLRSSESVDVDRRRGYFASRSQSECYFASLTVTLRAYSRRLHHPQERPTCRPTRFPAITQERTTSRSTVSPVRQCFVH